MRVDVSPELSRSQPYPVSQALLISSSLEGSPPPTHLLGPELRTFLRIRQSAK